jgi:hypothetical protein
MACAKFAVKLSGRVISFSFIAVLNNAFVLLAIVV